eukprot:ctg_2337.g587
MWMGDDHAGSARTARICRRLAVRPPINAPCGERPRGAPGFPAAPAGTPAAVCAAPLRAVAVTGGCPPAATQRARHRGVCRRRRRRRQRHRVAQRTGSPAVATAARTAAWRPRRSARAHYSNSATDSPRS